MSYDPQRSTWVNPNIEYMFDTEIIEYDIHDAGFTLIKQFKLLPQDKITELERVERGLKRHIMVGKLQGENKELSKALSNKFAEVRRIFIEMNQLTDNDIISVKKDAIYTIGTCNRTKFGLVEFAQKNTYTSYIRFPGNHNLEIYYSPDQIDVKGMSDSSVNRHRLYMLEFIKTSISMLEDKNPRLRRFLSDFINRYKSGDVDQRYYLEFNNISQNMDPAFNLRNVVIPIVQLTLKELD